MRRLSISAAWDESKAIFARDGQLLMAVALALVALPSAINGLLNPGGVSASETPWWIDLIAVIASLVALGGQLALIRLALGPSITVGGAIAHGMRRLPIYFLAVLMLVIALFLAAVPLAFLLSALGVPINQRPVPMSPALSFVSIAVLIAIIAIGVRLIMSSSVASAEDVGPIQIIKRSWALTSGNFWPLLGFLLMFLVATIILLTAIGSATNVVVRLTLGPAQPLSAAALVVALVSALVSAAVTTVFAVMLARIYLQLAGRSGAEVGVPSSGI
ncbi:hypothetical protein [Sphingomonas flavescens]|uniref:hypothetical protein n=1 Tax=Sphingomonas flavescens TaxID=3132797 RepID=UPI002803D0A1|nr:hypothetical protein [Sphingomonas limnosediminicola]